MNPSSDRVLRYLAGNENIENISIDELQNLAEESPYFSVAQFLLAKKLKAENHSGFLQQAQKTALYFSNPYWLHYQLSEEAWSDVLADEKHFIDGKTGNKESPLVAEFTGKKDTNVIHDDTNEPQDDNEPQDKKLQEPNEYSEASNENLAAQNIEQASQPEEEIASLVPEPDTDTEIFLDHLDEVVEEIFNNENKEVLQESHTPAEEETATEVMEEMAGVTNETDEVTEAFLNETQTSLEETAETAFKTPIPPFTSNISSEKKNDENIEPDEHEKMFQNIKAMLDATSEEADANAEDAVIPIDPYYTIDYFASQGIKLELEPNPKDQLGQNLKKFTQWLKHMKKLGPEDAAEVITRTDTEADIQQIAESSNTVREVVTEAMASVLEKQGKNDKAIELYKKLSFLNPHKSLYFAGKIKNLKGI